MSNAIPLMKRPVSELEARTTELPDGISWKPVLTVTHVEDLSDTPFCATYDDGSWLVDVNGCDMGIQWVRQRQPACTPDLATVQRVANGIRISAESIAAFALCGRFDEIERQIEWLARRARTQPDAPDDGDLPLDQFDEALLGQQRK